MGVQRLSATRVRLYTTLRTAHLERAHEFSPAAIVYGTRRYDFDEALLDGLEVVQAGPAAAARLIARARPDELEINEPLMLSSVRRTALTLLLLGRRKPRITTYAIGNADPFMMPPPSGLRAKLRYALDRRLARFVWRRVDRVAFGTQQAEATYRDVLGAVPGQDSTLIPALPARNDLVPTRDRGQQVVFLGAFSERKGFHLLLAAWPLVVSRVADARLTLVGKGGLEPMAVEFARLHDEVTLIVDPPRPLITTTLESSKVLVLASQPARTWREQVGLPIVEGLASGCLVVASDQTGLAPWLDGEGHRVVATPTSPEALADAIVDLLSSDLSPSDVVAALPRLDGRLDADRWMFAERG